MARIWIINAAGEKEEFAMDKVRHTCLRAGASEEIAERISEDVASRVRDGMNTRHILKMTLALLSKFEEPHVVARYDLKGAIMRLGPAGFPFETFFSEILAEYGYTVHTRQILNGFCISHEIDIVAEKEGDVQMVECKYRNSSGDYIGIKDALYTYARYLDLVEGYTAKKCPKFTSVALVTNTKFSGDVLRYASCKGMKLVGWGYPRGGSLQEMIEAKHLYPITVLRALDNLSQRRFAAANIMLCKHILQLEISELQERTGLGMRKLEGIRDEIAQVCGDEV